MRTPHLALDYIRSLYAPEDALLTRARQAAEALNHGWQVGAEEGKLLQFFIRAMGVRTVVEIGALTGYSALWMARALPQGGMLHAIDHDTKHCELARGFFAQSEVNGRITLHEGAGADVLETLIPQGPFDMVFIDADKPAYGTYLDWAEKHVRTGGLIVADNTFLFGAVYGKPAQKSAASTVEAMQRFNERLADEKKYFTAMVPTEEGMTVAIKLF